MIGIVTALEIEFAAVETMLDKAVNYTAQGSGAGRRYRRGEMPGSAGVPHQVVLALADKGNNASAIRAGLMLQHFPDIRHILMVGIAAGVPHPAKPEEHVRLGDVVLSDGQGVIQYDFDKATYDYGEEKPVVTPRPSPRPPSALLLEALRLHGASELLGDRAWLQYIKRGAELKDAQRPSDEFDLLHDTARRAQIIPHPVDPLRRPDEPRVFRGPIASANKLVRDPFLRDALRDAFGVKAIEMEGSGVADAAWAHEIGYLVIRGICDYADGYKNDIWHGYAALMAAAYTRGLLASMPSAEIPAASGDILKEMRAVLMDCDEFEGDDRLAAVFASEKLRPWRHQLKQAGSISARVDLAIGLLRERYRQVADSRGENALVLLLRELAERYDVSDLRHTRLLELSERARITL